MKTVFLLLAAVTLAATASWDTLQVMEPDREYWYEYESQALTGIPMLRSQFSGLKVKARIMIQLTRDRLVTMKLTSCRVYSVKEEEVDVTPHEWLPTSMLEEIPSETSRILIETLVMPVKFRYQDGLVTKIYVMDNDPYWSVNIKRGIMSLMHIDLNGENLMKEEPSSSDPFDSVIKSDYYTMSTKTGFKVLEPSVMGDCETRYSLVPDITGTELQVSKIIDATRCSPRIIGEKGVFAGLQMIPGLLITETHNIIEPSIAVDYLLNGTRHDFLIKTAVLTAKYSVAPFKKQEASMDAYILQKMHFIKDEKIAQPITFPKTPVMLPNGLHMHIPEGVTESVREHEIVPKIDVETKIKMIEELLEKFVQKSSSSSPIEEDVPDMPTTVVKLMMKMDKSDLIKLVEKFFKGGARTMDNKMTILLDMIPMVPNPEIPFVVTHMIKSGMISYPRALYSLNMATVMAPPVIETVDAFLELHKDPTVAREIAVKRALLINAGVVASKIFNLNIKRGHPMSRASSPLKSITKELKVMLGTENAMEKLTTIKAIGNIGLPELLPDLERCAKDKTECNDTRAQAVYSMRKMAKIMPRSIKPVLMPLYLNTNESVDVRIASFLIIMECKPSYSVVHTIAHSLTHEPSTQVASFIYSYLQNMARTTEPHVKILATIARKVLLMTKPVKTSPILHSKSRKWEIFSSILNSGMSLRTDVIHDTYKALPRSIVAKIYTRVFGVPLKFIEVGLNMSGIDEIIRKMVGTEGIITEILKGEVDVNRILEPLTKANLGSSVESSMQEILTKTNLPKPMVEILRLGAFIKMFDDEYSFVAFNKEDISRAITTAQSSYTSLIHTLTSGYEVDIVKAIPLIDNAIVLPTPIGMPIALKAHFITTMTIKGQIKLEGFNSIAAMFRNPTNMKLVTDIKTSIHHDNYASLCLQHDLLTIGTATKGHVAIIAPIKLELGVDTASETITMKHYMPKQITPEISAAMSNVLFTHMIPLEKSKYTASSYASHVPRSIDIKEDKYSEKYTIDNEITIPLLGAKVKITGKAREIPPAFVDTILLMKTAQDIKLKIEPSGEMPEVVVMEVKYGANPTQVRETRESSWFSWWDSSDSVEEATNEEEFIPVRPDSRITRPTSHKVMFEVFTEGGRSSSEKWKTLITLIYNPSWTIHQLNVQSIGGPFYPVVSTKWKAMINTVIDVPRLLKTIMALPGMDERSSEPICSWIISGGKSSFTEHELIMKMLPYETSDPMFTAMKPEMIEKQVPERNIYFKIDIDMSRMPEIVKEVISTRIPMTPSWLVPYVFKQKPPMSSISAGHMKLIVQLFPWLMTMNTAVALPSTTFYFMGIPIPETIMPQQYIIPVTEDVRTVSVFPEITSLTAIPKCLRSTFYGNCTVLPRKIVTLENITIDLPEMEPACEIVLAHDCSPQKLYSVISSPVKEGSIRMLKMIVPEYIIEVTPGNVHSGSTTIKINGAPKSVPTGEPLIMKKTIRNKEVEMLRIVKVKDTLMVKAVEVGVIVETNGELVSVKVSPMLHSSICGLCSHIPKIVIPTSIVEALRSEIPVDRTMKTVVVPYLLRSPTCPLSNTRYVAESSGTCPKVRRNVMIHRENRGTEEVCFSIRPVDICPRRCSPTQTTPMSLSFHCLDVNSVQAKPLIRESEERVLHEVANESVDTTESVDLPHSCIA